MVNDSGSSEARVSRSIRILMVDSILSHIYIYIDVHIVRDTKVKTIIVCLPRYGACKRGCAHEEDPHLDHI